MTQSATRTISSARSTAWGFSIFAMSGARVCSRTNSDVLRAAHEATAPRGRRRSAGPARRWREVLLRDGGQLVGRARDVEALARGDGAADLDLGVDLAVAGADRRGAQADGAVGEVEDVAGVDRARRGPAQEIVHPPRVADGPSSSPQKT